jgi:hypothetical protein
MRCDGARRKIMTLGDPTIAKLQTDFQALSEIASQLNVASDGLTKTVAILDEALKKLNVGLTVWVTFRRRANDEQPLLYDLDQIGYTKVNGTWGLAVQHIWGDEGAPDPWEDSDGPLLFNDAPREMRLQSVDKIPEVIAELAKEASDTTKRMQEKTKQVLELAEAINSLKDAAKASAIKAVKDEKAKSLTLAERITAGQKSLATDPLAAFRKGNIGFLSDLSGKEGGK